MAEIRNCPRCGKIFTYINRPICHSCLEQEENEFKVVKDYIYDNPGANIAEVSEATEISADKIMRFLREERLELVSENSNLILECERCGRAINSGRFCENCKDNISKDFKREFGIGNKPEAFKPQQRGDGDKMFTATRRKDK